MPILIAIAAFIFALFAIAAGAILAVAEAIANQPEKKKKKKKKRKPRRRPSNKMHSVIHREISPEEFEELIRGSRS